MEEKIVAVVDKETTAIDHTPIVTFLATETIRKGDRFEWDKAEKKLRRV